MSLDTGAAAAHGQHRQPVGGHQLGWGARGRDNHKNVDGRKRHTVVDSLGPLLAVVVTAADLDDAAAAPGALRQLADQPLGKVRLAYADSKCHTCPVPLGGGERLVRPGDRAPAKDSRGWVKLPVRWTVERRLIWTDCNGLINLEAGITVRPALGAICVLQYFSGS